MAPEAEPTPIRTAECHHPHPTHDGDRGRFISLPFNADLPGSLLIMDRDPLFTSQVRACFRSIGCRPKILPRRSPNLNAFIERFIGTVRREIGRFIIPLSLVGPEE